MTDKPYTVRMATPEDEPQLMVLCEKLAEENALFDPNYEKVRALVRNAVHNRQGFVGVIGPHDRLEGAILIQLGQTWYSDEILLEELFNYIPPEFRVPGKALQGLRTPGRADYLVEFAKSVADRMGLPLLIGIVSNTRTEAKMRLYDRKLPRAGAFYLYGAETGLKAGAA